MRSDLGNMYVQQVVDVWKDRVSLIGGYSLYSNYTSNNLDITVRPKVAQISSSYEGLYRVGVIVKPVKGVALYAMEATTSLPPTTSSASVARPLGLHATTVARPSAPRRLRL